MNLTDEDARHTLLVELQDDLVHGRARLGGLYRIAIGGVCGGPRLESRQVVPTRLLDRMGEPSCFRVGFIVRDLHTDHSMLDFQSLKYGQKTS